MAEYVPLYLPGASITGTAASAVVAGQAVAVSGDGKLAPTAAITDLIVGVAGQDAAVDGDLFTFFGRGTVHRLTAKGAITAGDSVEGGAAGGVVKHILGTKDVQVFGVALTTASGDGESVTVMEV